MTRHLYQLLCVLLCALGLSACTQTEKSELLNALPLDTDLIVVGNIKTIVESAGGSIGDSGITLPQQIMDMMDGRTTENFDELNQMLEDSGVDANAVALAFNYNQSKPMIIAMVKDADKLAKYLDNNDFVEKESSKGVTYYANGGADSDDTSTDCIAIRGNCVYFMEHSWGEKSQQLRQRVKDLIQKADDKSLAQTEMGEYVAQGNAGAVCFKMPPEALSSVNTTPDVAAVIKDAHICFMGDLKGDQATIAGAAFDKDGDAIDTGAVIGKSTSDINAKALKYIDGSESLVMAVSLKNVQWDKVLEKIAQVSGQNPAMFNAILPYLQDIDGTIAIGLGLKSGIAPLLNGASGEEIIRSLIATIVIETKDGKAETMVKTLGGMMAGARMPMRQTAGGYVMDLSQAGIDPILLESRDNFVILTTRPIENSSRNQTIEDIPFTKNLSAIGLSLDRNNQIMKDLGLKYDVTASLTASSDDPMLFTYKVSGDGPGGVVGKTIMMFRQLSEN